MGHVVIVAQFKLMLKELLEMYELAPATFETIKEGPDHRPSFMSTAKLLDVNQNQKSISGHPQRTIKEAENDAAYEAIHFLKSIYDVGVKDVNYEELKTVKEELNLLKKCFSNTNEELKSVKEELKLLRDGHSMIKKELEDAYQKLI